MNEKIDAITKFLDDKNIDENRQQFRKNLIVLLKYFSVHSNNEILVTELKDTFHQDPWYLAGVLFQSEHEDFIKKNVFKYKNQGEKSCIVFLINKSDIQNLIEEYDAIKDLHDFILDEPTKNDIERAITLLDRNNRCKIGSTNVDHIIYHGESYPAKCVGQIAYALANKVENDYLHPYVYTPYAIRDKVFKKNDIEYRPKENEESDPSNSENEEKPPLKQPLNQILYGPPGTGKTYHTINKAIEIIDNTFYQQHIDPTPDNRKVLKKRFDDLKKSGQIVFATFHQSFGYEEFVEGIKAKTTEKGIEYSVENGIFKNLSKTAQGQSKIVFSTDNSELTREVFKQLYDDYVLNLPNYSEAASNIILKTSSGTEFYLYKNTTPSIVVRAKNGTTVMSVAHAKLERVVFNKESYTYSSYEPIIINDILKNQIESETTDNTNKNYILIIDEINRGNISKIFGELITLIEDSKRIGTDEAIKVKLPYSNEEFGVPSNLYIIGTMNTADRSIAPIDTALRRRFVFEEMSPKPELLMANLDGTGIDLNKILTAINARIEYLYDRDHTIGHAYLIDVKTLNELKFAFKNKIIPLLAEYFYEDWENIDRVLNKNGFIIDSEKGSDPYLKGIDAINGKKIYSIKDSEKWELKDFVKIYSANETDVKLPE
jgi:5-methylcytosine-specific restriction enzyme B